MVCEDGYKAAGPKLRLICIKRFAQWQLRGKYQKPNLSCVPKNQDVGPFPKPVPNSPPCQLADFEEKFMNIVAKRYPESKYRFSPADFRMQPWKEGKLLKFRMFTGKGANVHPGVLARCRVKKNGYEKWVFVFKIDPAHVKTYDKLISYANHF